MTKSSLGCPRIPPRRPKGALWVSKWASGGHFGLKMKPLGCLLAANGLELEPCGVTQEPLWRQKAIYRWVLGAPWEHIKPIVHDAVDFRSNLCRCWSMFGDILSICLHKLCLQKRLSKTISQTETVMKTIPRSSNILMERRCVRDEKT